MIITAKCDMCGKEGDAKSIQRGYDDIDKCDKCRLEQDLIIFQETLKTHENKMELAESHVESCKDRIAMIKKELKELE